MAQVTAVHAWVMAQVPSTKLSYTSINMTISIIMQVISVLCVRGCSIYGCTFVRTKIECTLEQVHLILISSTISRTRLVGIHIVARIRNLNTYTDKYTNQNPCVRSTVFGSVAENKFPKMSIKQLPGFVLFMPQRYQLLYLTKSCPALASEAPRRTNTLF